MKELEQRVWQRVMGNQSVEDTQLRQLALDARQAASAYQKLLKSPVEHHRELGRKLMAGEQELLAAIRGLHYLQNGMPMKLPMSAGVTPDEKTWVKHYHCARRAMVEFTARSAEPEWGCVWSAMAKNREKQCTLLCQLLGCMK